MKKSRGERGAGDIKPLLFLIVIAYGIFCAVKIVPAKSDDGSVQKKVEEILKFAGPQVLKTADVEYRVKEAVKAYSIPVKPEEVLITDEGSQWRVKIKYTREIKLIFWTYKKDISIDHTGAKP